MTASGYRAAVLAAALAAALSAGPSAAGAGSLERVDLPSRTLGRDIPTVIYRPDRPPAGVLYLLHGYGGGEHDWSSAGVRETADGVFAGPEAVPLLIVMPGVGNSWYVDSERHGAWATALTSDLLATAEGAGAADFGRDRRFVAGLSMGGFGALHLAVHHPGRFRGAAALSPAVFEDVTDARQFPDFQIAFFAAAFGDPLDPDRFNARNVFAPLATLEQRAGAPTAFYLMTGDDDSLGLWHGTLQFFMAARRAGHAAELRVRDGDHEWRLWRDELEPVLRWVGGVIRAGPAAAQ